MSTLELDTFKSTVQDGENLSENYNLIVTVFDAKANYLNNLFENSDVKFSKNDEDPAHFILRLKSLNKALPNDGLAESSGIRLSQIDAGVKPESAVKHGMDNLDFWVEMAHDFIDDHDAVDMKVGKYWRDIVKR